MPETTEVTPEFLTPLPLHVHMVQSGGRRYFYFQANRGQENEGPRIRLKSPRSHVEIAEAQRRSAAAGASPRGPVLRCYTAAKGRAKTHHLQFSIDIPFLIDLLQLQGNRCAVSGIEFDERGYAACHMKPFGMSIDRVDGSCGYTKGNVRLVCCIANFAMGQWGLPALESLAHAIVAKSSNGDRTPLCKSFQSL